MDIKYFLHGNDGSSIEFSWAYDAETINAVTSDEYDRYGESNFHRADLIEFLETLLDDLKGDQ